MFRLVRLYPAAWRARYGEEFEALLEAQRFSVRIVLDVLLGALDAQLERGEGGSTMATRLRTPPALAIIVGSLLWLMQGLVSPLRIIGGGPWLLVVIAVGLVCMAVGIIGLGLIHERGRSLAMSMAILAGAGLIAGAAVEIAFLLGGIPFCCNEKVQMWPAVVGIGGLVAQAGFAVAALVVRVLPRLPLVAIAVLAALLAAVTAAMSFGGASANGLADLYLWSSAFLPVAWLSLGIAVLLSRPEPVLAA
jgi:hypothetical protein